MAPENLYTLEDNHTYTMLNERPGTYTGSPGAAKLDLGNNRPRPSRIDMSTDSDNESVMSNVKSLTNMTDPDDYTKGELVELLREARISRRSSRKGSAPNDYGKSHKKTSENEESSSSSGDSDLSSTSSEEENSEHDAAISG